MNAYNIEFVLNTKLAPLMKKRTLNLHVSVHYKAERMAMQLIIILVISIIGIILLGYYLMDRVDKYIENGGIADRPNIKVKNTVLIYGKGDAIEVLEEHMTRESFEYTVISEPYIPENLFLVIVLAISDNDMDNILVCNEARHMNPNVITIAKCNNTIYKNIFNNSGINRVLTGILSADEILLAMKG